MKKAWPERGLFIPDLETMTGERTFRFFECFPLTTLTGRKAADIVELLDIMRTASRESIFHHMHQYFLKPHAVTPEFPNDFAVWVSESLGEPLLAEALANVNPFEFANIEDLRAELMRIIREYLKAYPPPRPVLPGREFMFNEGITMVVPTSIESGPDLRDFARRLKEVDYSSVYFHFYESRLRLGRAVDDFSEFLATSLGRPDIAARIKSLDPYMYSTEVLRDKIVRLVSDGASS